MIAIWDCYDVFKLILWYTIFKNLTVIIKYYE